MCIRDRPGLIVGAAAAVSEAASNMVSVAVVMVLVFLFVPTLFASFYVSARDVFVEFAPDVSRPGHVE